MSLDVYLTGPEKQVKCLCRDCWHEHTCTEYDTYYSANITHNLGKMADAAGIYYALWRPEEIGVSKASELIALLEAGLAELKDTPEHYQQFNAKNGWGLYEHFVPFVENYLRACREYPDAKVRVSR